MAPKKADAAAPAKAGKKEVGEFADLSGLIKRGKVIEDQIRAESGGAATWISCIQGGTGYLTKSDAAYIKGAEAGDFVIGDRGLHLGAELTGTVIGMIKVYGQVKRSENENEMAKTISFWLAKDAEQIPVEGQFERPLNDGTVLVPMHWVFIDIDDHPEITDAMLSFRSTGNSYYKAFEKLVKKASSVCAQVKVKFVAEAVKNTKFNKTLYYPVGSIVGKNFEYDEETGEVSAIKGGMSQAEIKRILERYADFMESFAEMKVVTARSREQIAALIPGGGRAALPGGSRKGIPGSTGGYATEEDPEGEVPKF